MKSSLIQPSWKISGSNIFGIEDWEKFYNSKFSPQVLKNIPDFPWDESIFNRPCPFNPSKLIGKTHFCFLGLNNLNGEPLTIMKFFELHPNSRQPRFYRSANPWFADYEFAKWVTCRFGWYLMLTEIVPGSIEKPYDEQLELLPRNYSTPTAIEEIAKHFLYHLKNKIYLNPDKWARCSDNPWDDNHVNVGGFGEWGLSINCCKSTVSISTIGIGASRKLPR